MRHIGHIVGGQTIGSPSAMPVFNPATGEQTGAVASGGAAEVAAAVAAAMTAFPAWAATTPSGWCVE
jgi:malonate-semialdehyde dehydrogenase (acetylating)/methylmalonate-semialdehyde dehydrogenase